MNCIIGHRNQGTNMRSGPHSDSTTVPNSYTCAGAYGCYERQHNKWCFVSCEFPEGLCKGWVHKNWVTLIQQPHQQPHKQPHQRHQCWYGNCNRGDGSPIDPTSTSLDGTLYACPAHMEEFMAHRRIFKDTSNAPIVIANARIDYQALVSPHRSQANGHIQYALKVFRKATNSRVSHVKFHEYCESRNYVFDLYKFETFINRPR